MTDQLMFETWSELLRAEFPAGAHFGFKLRRRTITVNWLPFAGAEPVYGELHSLSIVFTNIAWKGYRGARAARRARADANLVALVKAAQSQYATEAAFKKPVDELEVEVASVDLFPPPVGGTQTSQGDLRAA